MKKLLYLIIAVLMGSSVIAQSGTKKTESFKVYGNCEMCKKTIEGVLKKNEGIISKKWDSESKLMTVTYDTTQISLHQIHKKIAAVGYDTDLEKAGDETYNKLHGCCQYDRPKK
jgi:periplasmic mercuric ion binding protein